MDIALQLKKNLGHGLKEHEVLRPYTKLNIGGVADFFYEARNIEELVHAAKVACSLNLPYIIFGAGTQVLVSDIGFPGLVIANQTSRISFIPEQSQIIADSGVSNTRLVMEAASRDMGGVEFLTTIPGTIGGAVYSNQGNFGFTVGSLTRTVTEFTPPENLRTHNIEWLDPSYLTTKIKRSSQLKPCPPIVLTVKLQLQRYKSQEIIRKIAYYQKLAKSGFVLFKNPSGDHIKLGDDADVIAKSATEILKKLGVQKISVGHARLDPHDPNRLINKGKAKASEVRQLIEQIKTLAAEQAGVLLEEAFEYVGKWE